MKRSDAVTKKDFNIIGYWHRGRLQGQENLYLYRITIKRTGKQIAEGFTSKRKAEQWLGVRIQLANQIKAGKISMDDINRRVEK